MEGQGAANDQREALNVLLRLRLDGKNGNTIKEKKVCTLPDDYRLRVPERVYQSTKLSSAAAAVAAAAACKPSQLAALCLNSCLGGQTPEQQETIYHKQLKSEVSALREFGNQMKERFFEGNTEASRDVRRLEFENRQLCAAQRLHDSQCKSLYDKIEVDFLGFYDETLACDLKYLEELTEERDHYYHTAIKTKEEGLEKESYYKSKEENLIKTFNTKIQEKEKQLFASNEKQIQMQTLIRQQKHNNAKYVTLIQQQRELLRKAAAEFKTLSAALQGNNKEAQQLKRLAQIEPQEEITEEQLQQAMARLVR
ncbi:hypothetical protein, conserved [Eimeria maxima]|uniref:Uncharacterized protein n=1 Tax=Eimeria maxima TaxID=5804 RepID=U6M0R1_EIMMA|nr:hypothetical protein, conserved [Eimeria maxima]CDJ57827.1 hypothetical protein, conserved [Eimeria maxima]